MTEAHGEVRTVRRRDGSYAVIADGATVYVNGWVAEAIRRHDEWTRDIERLASLHRCHWDEFSSESRCECGLTVDADGEWERHFAAEYNRLRVPDA